MLEEFLLYRMQLFALGDAFDGRNLAAFGLGPEHQARADDVAVGNNRAGAAVARAAAFLAAGQVQFVTQYIEQCLLRLAQIFDRLAVDDRGYVLFGHSVDSRDAPGGALKCNGGRSACEDAGNLGSVFDRAALVVDWFAGSLRGSVEPGKRIVVEPVAFQRLGGLVNDELGGRHGAEHDARIGAQAGGVQSDIDAAPDHRDIHLGTRDEAEIGVRLPGLGLWHAKLDDELALLERSLPGPGDDRLDRRLALAIRAGNDGDRTRADQRRDAVRGGR